MTTLTETYPKGMAGGMTDRAIGKVATEIGNMWRELFEDQRVPVSQGPGTRDAFNALAVIQAECSVPDWDGHGAVPVDPLSAEKAEKFLRALPASIPAPEVAVDPDGEVSLDWHRAPGDIFSISIARNGRLSWASAFGVRRYHATEFFIDEIPRAVMVQLDKLLASDLIEIEGS